MLHPRRYPLGFSVSDIPIVGPVVHSVESLLQGDICGTIPFDIIPGLKDEVAKIGCSPVGRDALIVALTAKGGPAVAAVGSTAVAECLCKGKLGPGVNIPPPPPPPSQAELLFKNPLVWLGLGAVVLALVMSSSKKPDKKSDKDTSGSTVNVNVLPAKD